jgi:hypothetical protein
LHHQFLKPGEGINEAAEAGETNHSPVPKYGSGGVRARHTHGVLDAGRKKRLGYAKYLHMSFPPFRCSFCCYYGLMLFLFFWLRWIEVNQMILKSRHDHHQLLLDESKYNKSNSFDSSKYARERQREQREQLSRLGLSEVEVVEYVLMLSWDETNMNARAKGNSGANTSETQVKEDQGMFEGDFNIEHNTDNEEGDEYNQSFTHSTFSGSRRSSTSLTSTIPVAWPLGLPP